MSDFNAYKDDYKQKVNESISFIGRNVDFFTEVKARHILSLASRLGAKGKGAKVLDVGCGIGLTDQLLSPSFQELHGVDIFEGVLAEAEKSNPDVRYKLYDGKVLPYEDEAFDLVFAICVFHHVKPPAWPDLMAEMRRVTRPSGIVAVFEHNPYNPLTRFVVARSEMDIGANLLKPKDVSKMMKESGLRLSEQRYILFTPWRSRIPSMTGTSLYKLPFGAQYYVAGEK